MLAEATSTIVLQAGVIVQAARDVFLDADAVADTAITTRGKYLGITYGSSSPEATVTVGEAATVLAGRNFTAEATAENTLTIRTIVPQAGDVAGISVSYGNAVARSLAEIRPGATVNAQNVTVRAANTGSLSNRATASGFPEGEIAGLGATLVLGNYQSSAQAVVSGNVTATGNLSIDATSRNLVNESRSAAQVSSPPPDSPILQALAEFLHSLDLSLLVDGRVVDPHAGAGPDVSVAAAVTLVESENKAAAWVDDGAFLSVGGNLNITSLAEEHFQDSAVANAADSTLVGIGGAVAWSKVANQATSFIGYNAVVDVAHTINLDSDATITNPVPTYYPPLALADTDTGTGSARVGEEYGDAAAVAGQIDAALAPLNAYLAPYLANPNTVGTSFVAAGSSSGSGTLIGGGVNYLDVYNLASSGIASGARVNQRGIVPAAADQQVVIDSTGTIRLANLAGLDSALNFVGGDAVGDPSVGGYFNGISADNYARSYIDDLAVVRAAQDVSISSQTINDILQATRSGSAGEDVGVDGSFSLVALGHESVAYIEDRASVCRA